VETDSASLRLVQKYVAVECKKEMRLLSSSIKNLNIDLFLLNNFRDIIFCSEISLALKNTCWISGTAFFGACTHIFALKTAKRINP